MGHNRQPQGHRLDQGHAEPFVLTGTNKNVGRLEIRPLGVALRNLARESHGRMNT